MHEPQSPDPTKRVYSDVIDTDPAPSTAGTVREVFRARHPATVSVMERARDYRVTYTLGDIHRLTFLSHEERAAVQAEWQAWHRRYVRLSRIGYVAWVAGAVTVWGCWFQSAGVSAALDGGIGLAVPAVGLQVIGAVIAVALLTTVPSFLATTSAPALGDAYLNGYADGMTRGVNRALRITPDVEQQMWDELRHAERTDASWKRAGRAAERSERIDHGSWPPTASLSR